MENKKTVTVWTLLHGEQLWKREFEVIEERPQFVKFMVNLREEDPLVGVFVHPEVLKHNNIFVFQGLIPMGGISARVKTLEYYLQDPTEGISALTELAEIELEAQKENVSERAIGDFGESLLTKFRSRTDKIVIQRAYIQVLAFPKRNYRGLILTFDKKSLCLIYWVVKSLSNELLVETVVSY